MGIFARLATLIKSNLNDLISRSEDPEKMLNQVVIDMANQLIEAKKQVAVSIADEKRLAKQAEQEAANAAEWERRAMLAIKAGDDALAKEALLRKGEKDAERVETQKSLQEQGVYADQLTAALKALDARLADIKLRQGSLRAKARANKKGSPLSGKTSAFDDFERMAGKIDTVEAEASLDEQLGGRTAESAAAERKLNEMAAQSSVDDALAELKKKLGGG